MITRILVEYKVIFAIEIMGYFYIVYFPCLIRFYEMVKTMIEMEEDVVDLDSEIPNTVIRVCTD